MHSDDVKDHLLAPDTSTSLTESEEWLQEGTLGMGQVAMTGIVLNQLTAHFGDGKYNNSHSKHAVGVLMMRSCKSAQGCGAVL